MFLLLMGCKYKVGSVSHPSRISTICFSTWVCVSDIPYYDIPRMSGSFIGQLELNLYSAIHCQHYCMGLLLGHFSVKELCMRNQLCDLCFPVIMRNIFRGHISAFHWYIWCQQLVMMLKKNEPRYTWDLSFRVRYSNFSFHFLTFYVSEMLVFTKPFSNVVSVICQSQTNPHQVIAQK